MTTPARQQYLRIKSRLNRDYPDAILPFRMGDFYETFDDAKTVAQELEIALTSREMGRGQRFPPAGIPYHQGLLIIGLKAREPGLPIKQDVILRESFSRRTQSL